MLSKNPCYTPNNYWLDCSCHFQVHIIVMHEYCLIQTHNYLPDKAINPCWYTMRDWTGPYTEHSVKNPFAYLYQHRPFLWAVDSLAAIYLRVFVGVLPTSSHVLLYFCRIHTVPWQVLTCLRYTPFCKQRLLER